MGCVAPSIPGDNLRPFKATCYMVGAEPGLSFPVECGIICSLQSVCVKIRKGRRLYNVYHVKHHYMTLKQLSMYAHPHKGLLSVFFQHFMYINDGNIAVVLVPCISVVCGSILSLCVFCCGYFSVRFFSPPRNMLVGEIAIPNHP